MRIKIIIDTEEEDMTIGYFATVLAEIIVEEAKQVINNDALQDCHGSNCGHDWEVSVSTEDTSDYEDDDYEPEGDEL